MGTRPRAAELSRPQVATHVQLLGLQRVKFLETTDRPRELKFGAIFFVFNKQGRRTAVPSDGWFDAAPFTLISDRDIVGIIIIIHTIRRTRGASPLCTQKSKIDELRCSTSPFDLRPRRQKHDKTQALRQHGNL